MEDTYLDDFEIDLHEVRQHYILREEASRKLNSLHSTGAQKEYVELAIGLTDRMGNFSAHEHQLGPRILDNNSINSVFKFSEKLVEEDVNVKMLLGIIRKANLPYLKIGVGSEMACLLQPDKFWVGNVRTIYSHLVIDHKGNWEKADEELSLYRFDDTSSEMHYKIWQEIYISMKNSLDVIYKISLNWAEEQGVKVGKHKYLWIDAVCNEIYECE
mgnify:CR=1 FL=1